MITWTERIITAEDSWRENEDLPTFLRMDRAFKAAGVRDLVKENQELRTELEKLHDMLSHLPVDIDDLMEAYEEDG